MGPLPDANRTATVRCLSFLPQLLPKLFLELSNGEAILTLFLLLPLPLCFLSALSALSLRSTQRLLRGGLLEAAFHAADAGFDFTINVRLDESGAVPSMISRRLTRRAERQTFRFTNQLLALSNSNYIVTFRTSVLFILRAFFVPLQTCNLLFLFSRSFYLCQNHYNKSTIVKGPFIKYVTLFLTNFDHPSPVKFCHTSWILLMYVTLWN